MGGRYTRRELEAMAEALISRTAGEIDLAGDPDMPSRDDYEAALDRTLDRLAALDRRRTASGGPPQK